MKILFSNPPWWVADKQTDRLRIGIRAGSRWPFTRHTNGAPDQFSPHEYLPTPFFLNSAAAWAKRAFPDADVQVRDSVARYESRDTYLRHIRTTAPDWLVFETATPCKEHDFALIEEIARNSPATKIILTGTIVADLKFPLPNGVFAAVKGEYEKGVQQIIKHGTKATIFGHSLLTNDELDELPFPLFDPETAMRYHDGCPTGQQFPQLQVWTSRGCPFRCCFCIWPAAMTGNDPDGTQPRRVRCHSPAWVQSMLLHQLQWAERKGTPYRSIYLDDDTFNLTPRHTRAISDVMGRIGLPWSAMCRGDTIKRDDWEHMRNNGCFGVKLGFETGVQRVADEIINKHLDIAKCAEVAKFLRHDLGMSVHGTFTVGMPGETPEEQQQTIDFIKRLYDEGAIDSHQLSETEVQDGTPLATLLASQKPLAKYPGMIPSTDYAVTLDGQAGIEARMARATQPTLTQ